MFMLEINKKILRKVFEELSKIDRLKPTTLWQNDNLTVFWDSNQKIITNLYDYKFYEILFTQSTAHPERIMTTGRIPTDKSTILIGYSSGFRASNLNNGVLTFENANGSDNEYFIPYKVLAYEHK
jgi:hypothetical protein